MKQFRYKDIDIIALADTHGKHRENEIPPCDIIIHAGDICNAGDEEEINDFFAWFSELPIEHKIFVHGNHDLPFELYPEQSCHRVPDNILYLNNAIVNLESITIVGIEATMGLLNDIEIDEKVDIIVSHCAPKSVVADGCAKLDILIEELKPAISIFGHLHEHRGFDKVINEVRYMNVVTI